MGRMKMRELALLTSGEVQALAARRPQPVIVIPSGSLEQHGPHLPLGTDALNSMATARELAGCLGGLLAPAIPYTWVGGTRVYPVGINPPAQVAVDYAAGLVRSLHAAGFCKFVLVNCHGGAIAGYRLLARVLLEEGIRILVLYPPSSFSREGPGKMLAGLDRETSTCLGALRLAGREQDVRRVLSRTREALAMFGEGRPAPEPPELPTIRRWAEVGFDYAHECQHVPPTLKASAAKGAAFIRALARAFVPTVREYEGSVESTGA